MRGIPPRAGVTQRESHGTLLGGFEGAVGGNDAVLHYSRLVPTMETNIPGLFLANSTFVINKTLSRDQMVVIARQAVDEILRTQGARKAIASNFFGKRKPAQGDELGRSAARDSLERLSR